MKTPRVSPTPLRLAKLTLIGSGVIMAAYAAAFLPFPQPLYRHGFPTMLWSIRLELVCSALPMLIGIAMLYYNNHRLSSGINHLRFTEDELEEARRFVNRSWLTGLQIGVLLAVVVLSLAELHSHRFAGNTPALILLAVNPINYLRTYLGKPPVKPAPIDWHSMQPIHSDQWGQTS